MSMADLKKCILAAGLGFDDCLEKPDLRKRAEEAFVKLKAASSSAAAPGDTPSAPAAPDVSKMNLAELRACIVSAGLRHDDCLEKPDIRKRAEEALVKLASQKASQPQKVEAPAPKSNSPAKKKKEKKEKKEKSEKKDKKDKKDKKEKDDKGSDSDDDDDNEVKNLEFDDAETKAVIANLAAFVATKGGKPSTADFFEEIRMQQLAKVFDTKVRLYVAFESLCGSTMDAKGVSQYSKQIEKVITNAKMSTAEVLWALGAYVKANPGSLKAYAMTLKAVFDEDWCEEKKLLEYYNEDEGEDDPGFADCKKSAAPFLKWLETADSDDDDDDSDSD